MTGSIAAGATPGMVNLAAIQAAQARIAGQVVRAPLRRSATLSTDTAPAFLKLENLQTTGSFKLRGATNALLAMQPAERARGLVTASSGNHGRALSHAGRAQGVRVVVCMSRLVPDNKVEAVRMLGADARIAGESQDDAQAEVDRLVRAEGLVEISAFDHPDVIAGQGTLGLEIVADLPDVALVLVPLSGGGLAAGVAAAVKGLRPQARVIGVSMARGAAMHASLAAGHPVAVEELPTLADALGGGIGLNNAYSFALCRDLLDGVILLDEAEIAAAIRHAALAEGETVEGGGAVGIGALLAGKLRAEGPTAVVVSGGNIDPARHAAILRQR